MDEKMVSLRINDIPVTVPKGSTVLEAARSAGFNIPSLCFLKDINEIGACRICVVEVKGAKSLVASCVYPVAEGMEVYTNTERVRKSRQLTLELILSNHRMDCLTCSRNSHCELLQLAGDLGIDAVRYANDNMPPQIEASAPHLVRDNSKCVLCRRCTAVCRKTQEVGVIGPNDRGFHTHIGCAFDRDLAEVDCVSCGQCIVACPTGALTEQGCEVTRCLSDLTQRKGPLPPEAAEQVRRSPTVWGCDLCQKACPHNQAAALTPLPEFREDLLCSLTLAELEPLSNKAFRRQYARRAFSWRGIGPLRRNLALKEETAPAEEEDRPSS